MGVPEICPWATTDPLLRAYHDRRWGKRVQEDKELFALLELESFSVGLSWRLILQKEDLLRSSLDGFDPLLCSKRTRERVDELLSLPGMIGHRGKIESVFSNARSFLAIQDEFGSFANYLGQTVGARVDHRRTATDPMPTFSNESTRLATDLKKRGFLYLGPVILYSYLQAIGFVDDHLVTCPFHGRKDDSSEDTRSRQSSHKSVPLRLRQGQCR